MSRVRDFREKNNLLQSEMAKIISVSEATYSKKENGQLRFSLAEAKKISDYFGQSIDAIFFDGEVSETETPS